MPVFFLMGCLIWQLPFFGNCTLFHGQGQEWTPWTSFLWTEWMSSAVYFAGISLSIRPSNVKPMVSIESIGRDIINP